jgi:hypothetical protein
LLPELASELRKSESPVETLMTPPRLPVETDWIPIEALSFSVTLEPRAKFAPPPMMPKVLVSPAFRAVDRSNSRSRPELR